MLFIRLNEKRSEKYYLDYLLCRDVSHYHGILLAFYRYPDHFFCDFKVDCIHPSSFQEMNPMDLKDWLDKKVDQYNVPGFIPNDPIVIPHRFQKKQDIEIAGFFAAILAWGQRKTIISKCLDLLERMDHAPYDFIVHFQEDDLKSWVGFKHRTFNDLDALYFAHRLQAHYRTYDSLETAFLPEDMGSAWDAKKGLEVFHHRFFSLPEAPGRTKKHISTPARGSSCKRLNMYLRWMVRRDDRGVDFGIWEKIKPSDLICPCDVHVERVARALGLVQRPKPDWPMAIELTEQLRQWDPEDPVRYDFALFGLGVEGRL